MSDDLLPDDDVDVHRVLTDRSLIFHDFPFFLFHVKPSHLHFEHDIRKG